MLSYSLENVAKELKERAPLFHSILSTASTNIRIKSRPAEGNYPAVAMATSVCLRSRTRDMLATQLMITTFLYHSGWMVRIHVTTCMYIPHKVTKFPTKKCIGNVYVTHFLRVKLCYFSYRPSIFNFKIHKG